MIDQFLFIAIFYSISDIENPGAGSSAVCFVSGRVWACIMVIVVALAGVSVSVAVPLALRSEPTAELPRRLDIAASLLGETPLVDG